MNTLSCAVTGHRPTRFKWKYKENNNGCRRLKRRMRDQFILLYENGCRHFWVGGALGVDMWAGEILLEMKGDPQYSEIELHLALPFAGYDSSWDPKSKSRMALIRKNCASSIIVGTVDKPAENYKKRNYYMVDHADVLLAVYDNDRSIRSGTGMTVNYAKKKELRIVLIHPDSAKVS